MILRCIDALSELTGKLCAWSLVAVGFFITFEIVMRYVFIAPTIWVDEVSRILQVWVVYLGAAYVLKHREMVTIELVLRNPNSLWRRLAESLAIVVMFVFAGVAIYYGFSLWLKETLAGHTTDTYLAPPKWITSAPVWVGNALLVLQGMAQLIRVWTEDLPEDDVLEGAH
ncbi:TRAP transporter small permease [Nisaea sediminum]|uniref:TRAP transporter small permease n=1 Tax=Nisaea sediminum TaxID=2775867 RepID=UPI0018692395|nr:TRAP transporter small permease [Nisaea sediminum]